MTEPARGQRAVYRCPACGAPADPQAKACSYCKALLHPVRCPWCFDWTEASGDCARCGSHAAPPAKGSKPLGCPTCRDGGELSGRELKDVRLSSCGRCGGVWADAESFKRLCDRREDRAAYLGGGSALERPKASDPSRVPVMYRPCAVCGEMMNRFNFAGCSGVILDACKPHGIWFDHEELARIVAFISEGGLDMARAKEIEKLELERKRLEKRVSEESLVRTAFTLPGDKARPDVFSAASDLLKFFF